MTMKIIHLCIMIRHICIRDISNYITHKKKFKFLYPTHKSYNKNDLKKFNLKRTSFLNFCFDTSVIKSSMSMIFFFSGPSG